MLFLQFLLLAVLLLGSNNEDVFQEQISFQTIHTLSLYNHSWTQSWSSGWLGDLQIHGWETHSGRFIFLRPWSKGNFSNKELTDIEVLFRTRYIEVLHIIHNHARQLMWELRPKAWLSIGPNPGSDHQRLTCHVSGFYPKLIWAMWMQGEQVQKGTQRSDILPNADGTWYLRIHLDVETIKTSGLSCRVRHSSLGGKDIILYLEHHNSVGLIILAVMVPLVLLIGLAFWLRKRWTRCGGPPVTLIPLK